MWRWTWWLSTGMHSSSRGWLHWEAATQRKPLRGLEHPSISPPCLRASCIPPTWRGWKFFAVVFYYVSNEMCCKITVVRQLPEDQPWDTRKVIFGTRCLMGLQWLRCVVVWYNAISKLSSGCLRLQPHQAGNWRIQAEGRFQPEGAEALQQEDGSPGEALCPRYLPHLDFVMICVV